MREGVSAAGAFAAGLGLACLVLTGCGGRRAPGPMSAGYASPSSSASEPAAPEPSAPATQAPGASAPATQAPPPGVSPEPSRPGPMEIAAKDTKYGRILVDGRGMTIYVAERDNGDFESTCTGACTREWPPLFTNGQVTAGPGVNSAWLGTIGRTDGPTQVEYNGWPLYHSARDRAPGEINGQGAVSNGGRWYVIDADKGQKMK
jgi:predicted lipoprotein with Yx(FWY)xxD motif